MYPNLSYFIQDLFGVYIPMPIQTFGFFVAIAFLICSYLFSIELKRKEKEGLVASTTKKVFIGANASISDYIISAVIGLIIGYKLLDIILNYSVFAENPQDSILSFDGNIWGAIVGGIFGIYMKYLENKKQKLDKPKWIEEDVHPYQHVGNMTVIAAIAGLIGAKIFHNLENFDELLRDPIGALITFSGLTMYGGLIFGAIAVIYYARKNGIKTLPLIDACAPGLMLAYGVGRIGCQLAGDGDWGINNLLPIPSSLSFLPEWMWAFKYPHNVIHAGIPIDGCVGSYCNELAVPVFPTPFYEVVMSIGLFFILWMIRKKITVSGILFSVYLLVNGVERFFIEKIRINEVYHLFGKAITQAEIISFLLITAGIAGIFYFKKKAKQKTPSLNEG